MRYLCLSILTLVFATSCLKRSEPGSEGKSIFNKKKKNKTARVDPDPNDPFRPYGENAVMKNGSDRGKAIDIDWRRSVVVVEAQLARRYFRDYNPATEFVIANVKEYDTFYVARVKKNAFLNVVINREQLFSKFPIHHTGLRFNLKPGEFFELVPQKKGSLKKRKTYRHLSFGIFALGAPGKYFGPKNSVKGDLVSAYMFFTPPEQAFRGRDIPNRYDMHELVLDQVHDTKEIFQLFESLSREGDRLKYQEIYGMFLNNCVHRLLSLLRQAHPQKASEGLIDRVLLATFDTDVLPTGLANGFTPVITKELERLGLVSDNARWKQYWMIPELYKWTHHIDCSENDSQQKISVTCEEAYTAPKKYLPESKRRAKSKLVSECVVFNVNRCLRDAGP